MTMNKFNCLLFAWALVSCTSEKNSEGTTTNAFDFSYTVDTVQVNAGDHFVYLQQSLVSSDITPDGTYLLNFNPKTIEMEIVNLDELKLSEVVKLEQEGPNGIGTNPYFFNYKALSKDEIMLSAWGRLIKVELAGNKVTNYSLKKEDLPEDALAPNEELKPGGIFSSDGTTFYSWYGFQEKPFDMEGLAKINLETSKVQLIPIPELDKMDEFTIEVDMSGPSGMKGKFPESLELLELDDKIIMQSSGINEFWVLDKSTLEVSVKANHSNLTEDVKPVQYSTKVTTQDEFRDARNARDQEVSFGKLIHDEGRDMIWRISSDFNRMKDQTVVRNYYLTFYDMDLNQLGEFPLENWELTGKSFIKDGDFYQFLNIDDEMAFVRLKPTFGDE